MDIPCGTAWVTGNRRAAGVTAADNAGWEILSHTTDHADRTTLTEAQLAADALACIALISSITGSTDNIGFVDPAHAKSAITDRILSRYYAYARGIADVSAGAIEGGSSINTPPESGACYNDAPFPPSGTVIPASTGWALVVTTIAMGPNVSTFTPFPVARNSAAGGGPFYAADLKFDLIDPPTSMSFTATLNGTAGVLINTGILAVSQYGVSVVCPVVHRRRLYAGYP